MTNSLREELFKLSAAERLELVEELWDSIAAETERDAGVLALTAEQKEELDRRIAAHRADPSATSSSCERSPRAPIWPRESGLSGPNELSGACWRKLRQGCAGELVDLVNLWPTSRP